MLIFNESMGNTEFRLLGGLLKFPPGGFSWKGVVCGGVMADSWPPGSSPALLWPGSHQNNPEICCQDAGLRPSALKEVLGYFRHLPEGALQEGKRTQ